MSDIGRMYGVPQKGKGRQPAPSGGGEMQERVASQLLDPELVPEVVLRKVILALGTSGRQDSIALVKSDLRAAKLVAKIIYQSEPGEKLGAGPQIATTRPAPAPAKSKGPARLKIS